MKISEAIRIVTALSDGVDPYTGEILSQNDPYQNPHTVRALFLALKGLEILQSKEKKTDSLAKNAGKPWSKEEEQQLLSQFEAGSTIHDLSVKHGRTKLAIQARLIKLGKLTVSSDHAIVTKARGTLIIS